MLHSYIFHTFLFNNINFHAAAIALAFSQLNVDLLLPLALVYTLQQCRVCTAMFSIAQQT